MGKSRLGQRRCDRVPECLLRQPDSSGAANLFANSRSRRVLARTRCTHLLRPVGCNQAKRGPRRYLSSLGTDHRSLRPREPEKTLRRVVRRVVTSPAVSNLVESETTLQSAI